MAELRTIEDIERDLRTANDRVTALEKELHQARCDVAGVHVGDIVSTRKGEARVTRVETTWQKKPWVHGVLRKKDGEWSIAVRCFYSDWEARDAD